MANSLPSQKEFIDFLAGLAVEGETALIVRQRLTGRKAELHGDGTLKASWIPFRPNDKTEIKKGGALYGNTGSFVEARMTEKLSASTANCDYVLCMVLDDIGTKSKEPPLAPTWIMETSEGCFQWGYTFSEQPTKGAFAAAIRAIADAGFTDPGACNPVRNFRIPGSVNLKPGRNKFESRLLEFHKGREYTLEQICEALNVEPGESLGTGLEPTKVKRTEDAVLNWLSDNKYLLSQVNHEGWCGVVCPNHEAHSVPEDVMARYNTNDRGFVCWHEHCQQLTSQDFLDWVAENGGPAVTHGLDNEALVATLTPALSKIAADPVTIAAATKSLAEIESKQASRLAKTELFDRFGYLASDDAYFDKETRQEYPRTVFNALFRHLECHSIHSNAKVLPSVFFDENREKKGGVILHGLTYAPGETSIVMKKDGLFGNKWRDGRPVVDKSLEGNVDRWLDHGRTLIPNEDEFEHILDVMAFKLQHPDTKINHAVLHAGREGSGKDTFWAPFIWAVCGPDNDNRGYLDSQTLNTAWGYHLESEVLLINELREPTLSERHALANNLKPVIAAPPDFLDVNRKGLHPYKALNRTFVLAFSNSRTPISLSTQDRRWFVIWSEAPRMREQDAMALWKWYKNDGGFQVIAAWLYQRDVSMFNPAASPMDTEYKQMLIEGGMSTAQAFLVHLIREGIGEFQTGVVGSPFFKLADRIQGQAPAGSKVHHAAVIEALQEAGWHNVGNLASRQHPTRKQVWVSPAMHDKLAEREITRSDLRNMVELPGPIHLLKKEA